MSLWADYLKEREGLDSIETEDGFVIYHIAGDRLLIEHVYIKPEKRNRHIGTALMKQLESIAKEKGCRSSFCTVQPKLPTADQSLRAALAFGFRPFNTDDLYLWLKKEIS